MKDLQDKYSIHDFCKLEDYPVIFSKGDENVVGRLKMKIKKS